MIATLGLALLAAAPLVEVQPGQARPGDAILVTVFNSSVLPEGTLGERSLVFIDAPHGGYQALTSLSVEAKPGSLVLAVTLTSDEGPTQVMGSVDIVDPHFARRELKVGREFTSPNKKQRQQSAADQDAFDAAFDVDYEPWAFDDDFSWPRPPAITAPFGDLRLINGRKKSQHFGIDLDGDTGDPIVAANDGTVVMVRPCFASGNTVLIAHGGRLFTSYFHLSAFEVKPGQQVKRGQRIGRVGKTGRVTGPHLHFGVKIDGRWVNPASLLSLDFDRGVGVAGPAAVPSESPERAPEGTR